MGTKYTTTAISGYNASPPPDDGTTGENNRTTWAKHKSKLTDPVKTLIEEINTKLLSHVDESMFDIAITRTTIAADHKRTINVTAGVTQSLGSATTLGAGHIVFIKNSHTASITIGRASGSDTIDGSANDVTLPPQTIAMFIVNTAANGYDSFVGGSARNGLKIVPAAAETAVVTASGGSITLDLLTGSYFYTPTLASIPTFIFSNPAVSGFGSSFKLELNNAGTYAPVWPVAVAWEDSVEPTWSTGKDFVQFLTRDGGTTWHAFPGGLNF